MESVYTKVFEVWSSKVDIVIAFFEIMFKRQIVIELIFSLSIFLIALIMYHIIKRHEIQNSFLTSSFHCGINLCIYAMAGSFCWLVYYGLIALFNPEYYAFIQLCKIF